MAGTGRSAWLALPETHPDTLAFCLMMIRLNACLGCISGSYRFMRGCELCSQQTIARYQGTDEELVALFHKAKEDLEGYHRGRGRAGCRQSPSPTRIWNEQDPYRRHRRWLCRA